MKLSKFTRLFTILLIAVFSPLAVLFILQFAEYLAFHLQENLHTELPLPLLYAAGGLFMLPCLAVLFLALPLSTAIEQDTVFTPETANRLSLIAKLLFFVCGGFLLVIIGLLALKEFTFTPILGIVDLLGLSIATLLQVLAGYIRRAAILKEEVDATL